MLAVLTTLLEVAMALRHMHAMQLVHCDLKPGNVLLKSSLSDVRHFTTKLCDFGLVKLRQEALDLTEQIRRATFTGTVTHSPPEMLRGDPNPQFAYDTYAFGILMWEMVSWTPVYAGLSDRQVAQQVGTDSPHQHAGGADHAAGGGHGAAPHACHAAGPLRPEAGQRAAEEQPERCAPLYDETVRLWAGKAPAGSVGPDGANPSRDLHRH
ncbi:protein kinase domain-containing protein, partial [Haematococcus lacustris]